MACPIIGTADGTAGAEAEARGAVEAAGYSAEARLDRGRLGGCRTRRGGILGGTCSSDHWRAGVEVGEGGSPTGTLLPSAAMPRAGVHIGGAWLAGHAQPVPLHSQAEGATCRLGAPACPPVRNSAH